MTYQKNQSKFYLFSLKVKFLALYYLKICIRDLMNNWITSDYILKITMGEQLHFIGRIVYIVSLVLMITYHLLAHTQDLNFWHKYFQPRINSHGY